MDELDRALAGLRREVVRAGARATARRREEERRARERLATAAAAANHGGNAAAAAGGRALARVRGLAPVRALQGLVESPGWIRIRVHVLAVLTAVLGILLIA